MKRDVTAWFVLWRLGKLCVESVEGVATARQVKLSNRMAEAASYRTVVPIAELDETPLAAAQRARAAKVEQIRHARAELNRLIRQFERLDDLALECGEERHQGTSAEPRA